jgi:hypothetical protein
LLSRSIYFTVLLEKKGPNVVVEWLTLRNREFPGSNLGLENVIVTEVFVVFLSPSMKMLG